jgi:hypothetical protein
VPFQVSFAIQLFHGFDIRIEFLGDMPGQLAWASATPLPVRGFQFTPRFS